MNKTLRTLTLLAIIALTSACGGAGGGGGGLYLDGGTEGSGVIVKVYTEGTISNESGSPAAGVAVSSIEHPEERTTTDTTGRFALDSTLNDRTLRLKVESSTVIDSVEIPDIATNVVGVNLELGLTRDSVEVNHIDVTLAGPTTPSRGGAANDVLGSVDESLNTIERQGGEPRTNGTSGSDSVNDDDQAVDPDFIGLQ